MYSDFLYSWFKYITITNYKRDLSLWRGLFLRSVKHLVVAEKGMWTFGHSLNNKYLLHS